MTAYVMEIAMDILFAFAMVIATIINCDSKQFT